MCTSMLIDVLYVKFLRVNNRILDRSLLCQSTQLRGLKLAWILYWVYQGQQEVWILFLSLLIDFKKCHILFPARRLSEFTVLNNKTQSNATIPNGNSHMPIANLNRQSPSNLCANHKPTLFYINLPTPSIFIFL